MPDDSERPSLQNVVRLPVQTIDVGATELCWSARSKRFRPLAIAIRSVVIECGRSAPGAVIPNNPVEHLARIPAQQLRAERRELRRDLEFHRGRAAQALDLLNIAESPEVRAAADDAARETLLIRTALRAIKAALWLQAVRAPGPTAA